MYNLPSPSLSPQCNHSCQMTWFLQNVIPANTDPTVSSLAVANLSVVSLVKSSHHLITSIYTYLRILTTSVYVAPSQFPTSLTHTLTQLPNVQQETTINYSQPQLMSTHTPLQPTTGIHTFHLPTAFAVQQLLMPLRHQLIQPLFNQLTSPCN